MSENIYRALLEGNRRDSLFSTSMQQLLSSSRPNIKVEDWEEELQKQSISKEDMNNLIMDYLVSEECKEAAECFQAEANVTSRL